MSQKGSISIYISVMLLSILLVISSGISILILDQIKMSRQIGHSIVSYYAAESGIERCLCDVRENKYNCTGNCSYTNVSLDFNSNAKYTSTYNELNKINSTGVFFDTSRKIELNW